MATSMYWANALILVRCRLFMSNVRVTPTPVKIPSSSSVWQLEHKVAKSDFPFALSTTIPDEEEEEDEEDEEDELDGWV